MFPRLSLDYDSRQLINNILAQVKNHPMYVGYHVEKDEVSYMDAGAIGIIIQSPNLRVNNLFLFYPTSDASGKIGSCAIYGTNLDGHKIDIERSMSLFGLPVHSVEWDAGIECFLDVTLEDY